MFCPFCGAVLPLPDSNSDLFRCYCCRREHTIEVYGDMKSEFTILFHPLGGVRRDEARPGDEAEGPTVDRRCPACGNSKMSYATLQLRSADEGQTVFYTCTKCKFKETENS